MYMYIYVYTYICSHHSSVVESAALKKLVIRKVPGSIPAENTSPQIHMDLST